MGVHQTAVSQWESGRTTPAFDTIWELCDLFDVDPHYLLGHSEKRGRFRLTTKEEEELGRIAADEDFPCPRARIASALDKLNPDGQQKAVERVEELTEIPKYKA